MSTQKKTVYVGLSGGVDSSVAALLLQQEGYEVVGVFIKSFNIDGCDAQDAEDARRVAGHLNIPFHVFDLEDEYKKEVVAYMIDEYKRGRTPNPDVVCNQAIKFGHFFKKARALGADYIATGHYARKREYGDVQYLAEATDMNKDQTYFLWTLTQEQLRHTLFPIGPYLKQEVRDMAHVAGLPTADKKDSQGICFLGQITLEDFLSEYIPKKTGAIITPDGTKVGEHHGAHMYTVGQRHLGVPIHTAGNTPTEPFYVVATDITANLVIVAPGKTSPYAACTSIVLERTHLTNPKEYDAVPQTVWVRTRYRQSLRKAILDTRDATLWITFAEPHYFVAPGQSAVWYDNDGVLHGGGIITACQDTKDYSSEVFSSSAVSD